MTTVYNDGNSHPLFSICIPAYNAQSYIGSCLESLAKQSFKDYEIVLVDDGSKLPLTLDEPTIITQHVQIIRTLNRGPYAARQSAALVADGEYIIFIDADDALYDDKALACIADVVVASQPDVIMFNAVKENGDLFVDNSSYGLKGEISPNEILRAMALNHKLNSLCCMAFRKRILVKDSLGMKLCYAEDRLQKFELIRKAKSIRLINKSFYIYNDVSTSTTHAQYNTSYYLQACYVEERISRYFDEIGVDWSGWAEGFMRATCGHLLALATDTRLKRNERMNHYSIFREQHAFEMALELLDKRSINYFMRFWIFLFDKRQFGVLDIVLRLRYIVGIVIYR